MVYLFHVLAGYVAGGLIQAPTRICASCHGQFILAVALGVVQRHTSKKRPTHYSPLVNHAASASTSPTMAAAASGFPNAWPATTKKHPNAMSSVMPETVNHPDHYNAGAVECITAIEAALTPEEFRGYCKGNALKYIWRERHKGERSSLAKAAWYLARLLGKLEP